MHTFGNMNKRYSTVRKVWQVLQKGSSRPQVMEDAQGDRFLVKLRGSLSNPYASVSDFLCCHIGLALGLPVVQPHLIGINDEIDLELVDAEARDAVQKSMGINIAYPFLEEATDVLSDQLPDHPALLDLFLLDCFMLNIDRNPQNTNLLIANDQLQSFDYETSMLVLAALSQQTTNIVPMVLQQLRRNPLYQENIPVERIQAMQFKLQALDLSELFSPIPADWLEKGSERDVNLRTCLQAALKDTHRLPFILAKLSEIQPETEEMRRTRQLANRAQFERKLKEDQQR
jgi:hypothetical protein